MEPSEAPILTPWISIFSNTYLLGFALLLSLFIVFVMFFMLKSRSCHDWYLMLFTTLAVFVILMLFPFIQSSRLAPGEETEQFIDIDRPWLLILTYAFTAFILCAATTSIEYIIVYVKPSWEDKWWLTILRVFTTILSLSFPLIDVGIEYSKEDESSHCQDNVCRWYLTRKDATLCVLLLFWSLSVSVTLISANIDQVLDLPNRFRMKKEKRKLEFGNMDEKRRPSESEMAYRRQIKIERERIMEIQRKKSEARREESIPLTTPEIPLINLNPQSTIDSTREIRSSSLVPPIRNPSGRRRVIEGTVRNPSMRGKRRVPTQDVL